MVEEPVKDRRQYVRAAVPDNTFAYIYYKQGNQTKRLKSKIENLSPNGISLNTKGYGCKTGAKYHIVIVIHLQNVANVTKIYHMDATVVHKTNDKTGFYMVRRIKDKC